MEHGEKYIMISIIEKQESNFGKIVTSMKQVMASSRYLLLMSLKFLRVE
jgi:hypothetical protein